MHWIKHVPQIDHQCLKGIDYAIKHWQRQYEHFLYGVKLTWKTFQTTVKICQTEADTATPEFLFFLPQHQVHNQVYIKNHQNCTFQIYKRHTSCTKNQSTESSKMKQQFHLF